MTMLKWKLVSVYLEIVLLPVQDRCMVCTRSTIGSEIVLNTPDGPRGDKGQVKAWSVWR